MFGPAADGETAAANTASPQATDEAAITSSWRPAIHATSAPPVRAAPLAARSDKKAVARQVRPATRHASRAPSSTAGRTTPRAAPRMNAASGCHTGLPPGSLRRKIQRAARPVELDLRKGDEAAIQHLPDPR